jgi:hypothetical protein
MNGINGINRIFALSTMMGRTFDSLDYQPRPRYQRPPRKCLRKGCENMTRHNHGYCSAECCKADK